MADTILPAETLSAIEKLERSSTGGDKRIIDLDSELRRQADMKEFFLTRNNIAVKSHIGDVERTGFSVLKYYMVWMLNQPYFRHCTEEELRTKLVSIPGLGECIDEYLALSRSIGGESSVHWVEANKAGSISIHPNYSPMGENKTMANQRKKFLGII